MINRRIFQLAAAALPLCGLAIFSGAARADAMGPGAHMFQMMDSNGDGKISAEEHAAGAKLMFETMDANKDGKVTAAEMDAAHEKMMGMHKKAGEKAGAKPHMSSADKIKVIDTNGDGVLSADEHAAGSVTMFDKMDTDHDGFVTKTEMEAGHAKLMSKTPHK